MAEGGSLTIAVLVKQVPDMNAIRIDRARGTIVPSPQNVMSSYDQYAVEAALRLKESLGGGSSPSRAVRHRRATSSPVR
jgi:electron transfer flavoprotein alpha/beta subunit